MIFLTWGDFWLPMAVARIVGLWCRCLWVVEWERKCGAFCRFRKQGEASREKERSIKVQSCDEHIECLGLLVCLDDRGRFVKGKTDQLVGQAEKIRVADPTSDIQGHIVVLWHGDEIVNLFQKFLGFLCLFFETLRQDDRQEVFPLGTKGSSNGGG